MLNNKGMKNLKTERLFLRKFRIEDLEEFYKLYNDDEFIKWSNHSKINRQESIQILENILRRYDNNEIWYYYWAICKKTDDRVIGGIKLHGFNNNNNSISFDYSIISSESRKGYITEAFKKVIEFCFDDLEANRIEGICSTKNYASKKVMEKAGMHEEGILKQYIKLHEIYHDCYISSLIREEK